VRRRGFIKVIAGLTVGWPLAAPAQQPDRMRRIGVLMAFAEGDPEGQAWVAAFREGLQKVGWSEGSNIRIDYGWAGGDTESRKQIAKELVAHQPDLVVTQNTPTTQAAMLYTQNIPIIFANVADPIGSGFVASFSRPGGNITGFVNLEGSLGGKWLELLKEIAPGVHRVAFLFNPITAPFADYFLGPFKVAARSFMVDAISGSVRDVSELESVVTAMAREPNAGLIVMPDTFLNVHRSQVLSLAADHQLPAIYPYRFFAELGGLLSFGTEPLNNFRRATTYVDRILRGEKPVDLPVQAPTKYDLVVNLRTAKTLGLTVPPSLLARADEIID
jgi:putative tryptophan/tyrosine transport system substrate-binding protein